MTSSSGKPPGNDGEKLKMKSSLRMRSRRQGAGSEAEASEKTGYTITKKGGRFADMSFLRIEDRPVQVSQSENMESSGNRKETIISCVPNFFHGCPCSEPWKTGWRQR